MGRSSKNFKFELKGVYSCTNGKGVCKKEWVREEELVAPMLEYLEQIQLSDDLIEKIIGYLKKSFEAEQEFHKQTQESLRKELDQVQRGISRLPFWGIPEKHFKLLRIKRLRLALAHN